MPNDQPVRVPRGQVVAISGAASGIGAATARLAVAKGYRVAVCDIDLSAAERLVEELGSQARAVALDIRSAASWEFALDEVELQLGLVDVLINNAGIIRTGYAIDLPIEKHREMIEVNLIGASTGILAGLERMKVRGSGHLVTICSMSSFLPLPGYATYAGTKHALRAFHHAVALEERDSPVDFTIIHPTSTKTPMLVQEMADPSSVISFAEQPDTPETVAEAIVKALRTKPSEVVFPAIGGRFQRLMGTQHALIRAILPMVLSTAERNRSRVSRAAEMNE
jgi:short-subunit dehydrogenase